MFLLGNLVLKCKQYTYLNNAESTYQIKLLGCHYYPSFKEHTKRENCKVLSTQTYTS